MKSTVVDESLSSFKPMYCSRENQASTAPIVAKVLWENFLVNYGWPEKILTDQEEYFESSLVRELCQSAGVQKLRTTPYYPETNGQCECFNPMLIGMIGTLPTHVKKNWQEWVSTLVSAYNSTVSNATDFSPYFLMYGHHKQLPIDIEFRVTQIDISRPTHKNYVKKLKARLKWAYKVAKATSSKESGRHKWYYDHKFHCMALSLGDVVLVRMKAVGQDHKIADKWEQNPYVVISQMGNLPVFKVQPRNIKDQ